MKELIERVISFKMPSKESLQKIGSLVIYIGVISFILFEILRFSSPYLQNKLTSSKKELKEEILHQVKAELDYLITYQKEFNKSVSFTLDSMRNDIIIIINTSESNTQSILTLIKNSNLSSNDKMNEIIVLLDKSKDLGEKINKNNNIILTKIRVIKK